MAFYTGTHGRMEIRKGSASDQSDEDKEVEQLQVRNWQITTSVSQLDATTLADTDKVVVNGIRTTRGSCSVLYYKEATGDSSIKQLTRRLIDTRKDTDWDTTSPGQAASPHKCWLYFYVKTEGNTRMGYKLQANLTSVAMTCAVGDIVSAQIQFESIGAPIDFQS